MKRSIKLLILLAVFAMIVAACSSDDSDDTTTTAAAGGDETTTTAAESEALVVGVSWNNYNEERWARADEPAIQAALTAAGATYISADAGSSAEQQIADVENLIAQGANALIILAQDGTAIKPAVQSAIDQGIPVIAYDRLIEDSGAFYITFDNVEVGRMQARAIYDLVPEGNYVFIKGNSADANADFLRGGQEEVLLEATGCEELVAPCPIVNVGESYTDNWDPAVAQTNMDQFLTTNNNDVQAVVSSNDGMAGGVVSALDGQGLAGSVPVSGQDGDFAALNRVALGTQAVDVWKNAFALGQTAGEVAVQLAGGTALDAVTAPGNLGDSAPASGTAAEPFTTPGGVDVWSIILTPIPITQDNLNVVLDAGWITQDDLCKDVESGSVAVCP
ncbi:MAG: substrate-binding domain-containing protein [Acidimicrobiia bacterium]